MSWLVLRCARGSPSQNSSKEILHSVSHPFNIEEVVIFNGVLFELPNIFGAVVFRSFQGRLVEG
jgi:hypothetical protein